MLRVTKKIQNTFLTALAVGIIGFAAYGGYNISQALSGPGQDEAAGNNVVLTDVTGSAGVNTDGNICSPYGCAGCSGCTDPQPQTVVTTIYDTAGENGLVY